MDIESCETQPARIGSFGRLSSASSSRRRSLSLSLSLSHLEAAIKSESVSEAGDIGDRALNSNRYSVSGRSHFSSDDFENGIVVPIQEDTHLENVSPLSTDTIVQSGEGKKDERNVLWFWEYIACLLSLAVFGILGVGSFLMGWFGVVFKSDIAKVSDQLAIGLTTGFLGSLTTFSGWNQSILDLSVRDQWVFSFLGIIIGLFLVSSSISFGIETAKGFNLLLVRSKMEFSFGCTTRFRDCTLNKFQRILTSILMLLLILGLFWGIFIVLEKKSFESGGSDAELYLACLVGPLGVWLRWFLARFNGRGFGKGQMLKWIPFGTLAANVLAACIMAGLATLKKAVNTRTCDTVGNGIQLGLLGCLSTVSTFMAEFQAMRKSMNAWRAYVYAMITFFVSFVLGTLIYSVPVWAKGYN